MSTQVATKEQAFPIVKYDVSEGAIAELKDSYQGLEASTPAGYKEVKIALAKMVKTRTGLERHRLTLNADAKIHIAKVNSRAKELKALLLEVEEPLREKRDAVDDAKQRIKAAKEQAERDRVEACMATIQDLRMVPADLIGGDMERMEDLLGKLSNMTFDPGEYQGLLPEANQTLGGTIAKVQIMIEERKKADAAAAEMKKERAAMEKARQEIERKEEAAEAKRKANFEELVAAQAKLDEAQAKLKAEQESAATEKRRDEERVAAEAEQKEQELHAKRDKEQEEWKEKEMQEAAARQKELDAERKDAARPDVEKLLHFMNAVLAETLNQIPEVGEECQPIADIIQRNIEGFLEELEAVLEKME